MVFKAFEEERESFLMVVVVDAVVSAVIDVDGPGVGADASCVDADAGSVVSVVDAAVDADVTYDDAAIVDVDYVDAVGSSAFNAGVGVGFGGDVDIDADADGVCRLLLRLLLLTMLFQRVHVLRCH